ncbi:Zn-ribbon domain-containing OB-fold protein [Pseudomonas sp. MWU13-2105]|uniref:Zn-ribbon domain-containing OB-fold protein n=1 Tax=Pseudomonas sp. MWU13-2105 TaxID=2935074 RepID=UPI00200F392C|nr:OB-fold domain-containing protein [Pseudomonas sp. MWU13-2105]
MIDIHERAPYQRYLEGLARGALVYQHCNHCQSAVFYLRLCCPACGSVALTLRDSQGLGTLYSSSVVFDKEHNYNIVLVDLDEGFRMMSTVLDCAAPSIGARVKARVEHQQSAGPRVVFELAEGGMA